MRVSGLDPKNPDLPAQIVRIPFLPGEPVKILPGRRPISAIGVEIAEHMIEGSVLKHKLDNVVNLAELVPHGRPRLGVFTND